MAPLKKKVSRRLDDNDRLYSKQYYQPEQPGALTGASTHLKHATTRNGLPLNAKQKQQRLNWLKTQESYTLHAPVQRNFPRRPVIVPGIHHQYQADLCDLTRLAKFNNGYKFILTVIDVFSKKAYARPLKQKTGQALVTAFKSVLTESRECPRILLTDKGTEFKNAAFQRLLKERGIRFVTSQNAEIKASVVERFNKTLKNRLFRYFTREKTHRYTPVLQALIDNYNGTYHHAIKTQPRLVNAQNQSRIYEVLYRKAIRHHFAPQKKKHPGLSYA